MSSVELFRAKVSPGFREPLVQNRFVGRDRELQRLEEILTERKSATVLLAGFRGAGKTALVDEALRHARLSSKQLVVRIAPPYIDSGSDTPGIRSQILRSLARVLYFEALEVEGLPKGVLERISATYEKTYLTELEKHSVMETVASSAVVERESTVVRTSLDISASVRLLVGGLAMGLVGTLGVGAGVWAGDRLGVGWGVAAAVFVVVLAVAGGLTFERTRTDEEDVVSALVQKDGRTALGRFDLSDETLEFELRRSLAELAREGHRVTFVLDELDKLDLNDAAPSSVEESAVFAILTSLKNFFMLGNAVYIFITDDEFFERVSLEQRAGGYALSHTIFSDRMYVGPLHYSELEELIDGSIREIPSVEDYHRFRNYVCWESKNHAFDALQVLASFVENRDGEPVLAPTCSGEDDGVWKEGSLPADWLTKAALQKHVGVSFDEARRSGQGEALYNQALWDSLHEVAATLLEGGEVAVTDEGVIDVPGRFIKSLSQDDTDGVAGAVQRMLLRMERHRAVHEETGEVSVADENREEEPSEAPTKVPAQIFKLVSNVAYPPSTIASESVLLPAEETLVETMRRLELTLERSDGLAVLSAEQNQILDQLRSIARSVKQTGPRRTQKRSAVIAAIPDAGDLAEAVVRDSVAGAVDSWASTSNVIVGRGLGTPSPRSGQPWLQTLSQDFAPLVTKLQEVGIEPLIVGGNANENALLVLSLVDDEDAIALQSAYAECLASDQNTRDERKQRLPIVHVGIETRDDARLPMEMVEVITEVQPTGWWARIAGGGSPLRSRRKAETELLGWSHFELDGTLENIDELSDVLGDVSFVRTQD